MRTERALERLGEHQDRISAILDRGRRAIETSRDVESAKLAHLRWELLRVLRDYQLFKHMEIFDPVIRTGAPAQAALARELKTRCMRVASRYVEHAQRWTLNAAVDAWPAYRADALELIDALVAHLVDEARDTGSLLAGIEHTRQRPAGR